MPAMTTMAGGDNNNGGVLTIMAVILTTMVGGSAAMARGATNALSSQVCALADSVGVRRRSCRCAQVCVGGSVGVHKR